MRKDVGNMAAFKSLPSYTCQGLHSTSVEQIWVVYLGHERNFAPRICLASAASACSVKPEPITEEVQFLEKQLVT